MYYKKIKWCSKSVKAPWQPPDFVFVIAWTFLYTTYGLTLYWANQSRTRALLWWGLGLNLLWIPVYKYSTKLALVLLIAMIGVATVAQKQLGEDDLHTEAVYQFIYLMWLIFALTLNAYIVLKCP